jgi:NifB/MoaA-like Fe-S oxidoreductase
VEACQCLEVNGVCKYLQMMGIREDLQVKDVCNYRSLMHSYKYP